MKLIDEVKQSLSRLWQRLRLGPPPALPPAPSTPVNRTTAPAPAPGTTPAATPTPTLALPPAPEPVGTGAGATDLPAPPPAPAPRARRPDAPPALPAPAAGDAPAAGPAIDDGIEEESPAAAPGRGRFSHGSFTDSRGRTRAFKLYVPPGLRADPRPRALVVMLHGCQQDPDDFAAGTAINEAARTQGFYVLYPAQTEEANRYRCWNWFSMRNQMVGQGMAGYIAELTAHVMAHRRIDPGRVFIAGLSAGGAMAALMGWLYPEVYAAVGVHSGMAPGAARGPVGALMAMRRGRPGWAASTPAVGAPARPPLIVFQGDADKVVNPVNADHLVASWLPDPLRPQQQRLELNGRKVTQRIWRARKPRGGAEGAVQAELWLVHGQGHAWSGGHPGGSYCDPSGPDATAQMLRFFAEHVRGPAGENAEADAPATAAAA